MEKSFTIAANKDLLISNAMSHIISRKSDTKVVSLGKSTSFKSIKSQLINKDFDIACIPLSKASFGLPDGIVLAGVSNRADPRLHFIGLHESIEGKTLRDLKEGAKISVRDQIIKDQLLTLLPNADIFVQKMSIQKLESELAKKHLDGFIIPAYEIEFSPLQLDQYYQWEFSPYELVGLPADGIATFICRMDDIPSRTFIKRFHHGPTSRCSNIERKIKRAFGKEPISAFCYRDERKFFQVHASHTNVEHNRCFFSQSTTTGLAEKIIEIIKNEANVSHI